VSGYNRCEMTAFPRTTLCLLLALASPMLFDSGAGADDAVPREVVDTSMANRIHGAWNEIRELQRAGRKEDSERLQRSFATEFFEDYLEHPDTTPGQQALTTAFRMWGNVGAVTEIEQALPRIDRGSSLWEHLALSARPAFVAAGRLDDFRGLVTALTADLTDPVAATGVWVLLGRDYRSTGDLEQAGDCFRKVVELAADPFFVRVAESALHDMDKLAVGMPAPDFEATSLDGRPIRLSSLRGKIVLLEFWSTTCPPCLPEIDHLKRIRNEFPLEQVVLIGISMDRELSDVRKMIADKGIDWPQLCDAKGSGGLVPLLYNVTGIPRSFLIDRDGRIAIRDLRGDDLEQAVRELAAASGETGAAARPATGG